jgi:O-antigen ligase/tetratricopeptide (TPR) repeat protein
VQNSDGSASPIVEFTDGHAQKPVLDRCLCAAIEAVLLLMALAAPWGLGGVAPEAVVGLNVGLGVVLMLWGVRMVIRRRLFFRGDATLAALGGLALLSLLQLLPLPSPALGLVSPNTLETNVRLRPEVRERLPGEPGPDVPRPDSFPVSLSPPDTRAFFADIFALALLYAAARSNLTGSGPLYRLAWVMAANGALLCAVGIAQRVSSPPDTVYWSIRTDGTVFGPFGNRNHLPYYANVCLGLGCALLAPRFRGGLSEVLNRPMAVWLLLLVAVTAGGIVFSQSRGGVVAGVGAAAGCLVVWARHARRLSGLGWVVAAGLAVAAVGAWIGSGQWTARLVSVRENQLAEDLRTQIWADGLRLFVQYPVLGTGGGTFTWVETAARTRTGYEALSVEYAHNEYIEAMAEGGVLRLVITLWLVVGVCRRVVRRHRRVANRPEAPLLLGGLYGVLAVALHSFVDFGLHMPAVAVLATVLVAELMAACDGRRGTPADPARRPLVVAVAAACLLAAAGALLAWDAWTAQRAERSRLAAAGFTGRKRLTADQAERAVRLIGAAAAARPGNALYRHELGQAHLAVALTFPEGSPEREVALREALGHWRAARDLSPVIAPTHARLGRHRDLFQRADPALTYFLRARSLMPTDPEIIYSCGEARWKAGDAAGACEDWKESLNRSDQFLKDVLDRAAQRLTPEQILSEALPDRPEIVFKAATILFENADPRPPAYRAYLRKALELLTAKVTGKTAADWELQGKLEARLDHPNEAIVAYRRAVGLAPRRADWRFEYAQLLYNIATDESNAPNRDPERSSQWLNMLKDAEHELELVWELEPRNRDARNLWEIVRRQIRLLEVSNPRPSRTEKGKAGSNHP